MKAWGTLALIALIALSFSTRTAHAAEPQKIMPRPAEPDFREVEEILTAIDDDVAEYLPHFDLGGIFRSIASGNLRADAGHILSGITRYFFHETQANTKLLGALVVLTVISALLQNLQVNFGSEAVARLAYSACHLVLITLAIGSFNVAMRVAQQSVWSLISLMRALLPTLIMLIASSGAPVTAGLLSPLMVTTLQVVGGIVSGVVLPLFLFTAVLDIVNHVWEEFDLSGVASLLRLGANSVLGLSLAVYLGIVAVQKAAGAVSDNVALRTAKFLSNTFIPVVGKMFSDAAEMVLSSTSVLKGAVGAAGAFAVFLIVVFPIAKILSAVLVYRLAAALVQPLGSKRIVSCLNSISNSLVMMCVCLGAVAMMLWVSLAVLASAARPI